MNGRKIVEAGLRTSLLLAISVVLVAGFWFHQTFYQLGLYPLLLLGGLATFMVIISGHFALSSRPSWRRPSRTIGLTPEEGEHLILGTSSLLTLQPQAGSELRAGTVVSAKYAHGSSTIAVLRIKESYRKLPADISEEEIRALGFQTRQNLHSFFVKRGRLNQDEPITLVRFRVIERGVSEST